MTILLEFLRPHGWLALAAMLFINGAICYRFGGRTLFFTIPVVVIAYWILDIGWIRSEIAKPGWDGVPDQDAVFILGMMLRGVVAAMALFLSFVVAAFLSNTVGAGNDTMKSQMVDHKQRPIYRPRL